MVVLNEEHMPLDGAANPIVRLYECGDASQFITHQTALCDAQPREQLQWVGSGYLNLAGDQPHNEISKL